MSTTATGQPSVLLIGSRAAAFGVELAALGELQIAGAVEAANARDVLRARTTDVALIDLDGERRIILDFAQSLRLEFPRLALVVRGSHEEGADAELDFVAAGVSEYVDHAADIRALARTLRQAHARAQLTVGDDAARRLAISMIERNERRYRDLFENSLGLICMHDVDGVLLGANPAAASALGYAVAEMVGRPLADFVPPQLHRYFADYLKRVADRHSDKGLLYLTHRNGEQRVWEYNNRLSFETDGTPFVMGNAQDVTASRLVERRQREQSAEMEAVNDAALVGLFHADTAGHCTYVNSTFERMSGLHAAQAAGNGWLDPVHAEDRARVVDEWHAALAQGQRHRSEFRYLQADGRVVWVQLQAAPIVLDGRVTGFVGCVEDITARRRAEESLRRSEQRLRTIADALPAMIFYLDAKLRFVFANAMYERVYGDGRSVVGRYVRDVLDIANYEQRQPWLARALAGERVSFEIQQAVDGVNRWFEFNYLPQRDEDERDVVGIHALALDVTQQHAEEERLTLLAEIDPLTGLVNRAGFALRLSRALARSRDQRTTLAVMYLDIDYFKQINDTHGHGTGDALLKAFAARLAGNLRSSDVAGRLGGDEFVVITEGVQRREYAAVVAAKIVTSMRKPFALDGVDVTVSTSVGLAFGTGAESADTLVKRADEALYRAKQAGRNGYRVAE